MSGIQSWFLKGCLCSLSGVLFATSALTAHGQQVARRIAGAVDDGSRVTLSGNTPPQAQPLYDQGAVNDSIPLNRMLLVLKRSPEQETALKGLMSDLHNPNSAQYHKWMKPADFSTQFGLGDADMQTVTAWLQSKGFTVNTVSQGKTTISFSGNAGQLRSAFHTELHTYIKDGVTFHANNRDPQIPVALSPVVAGLASLNDIKPASYTQVLGRARYSPRTHQSTPQWSYPADSGGVYLVVAPGDFAVQYDVNPVYKAGYTGSGETIGIISASGVDDTVIGNYRKLFGLSDNLPSEIVVGNDPGSNGDGAGDEAALDVEVSGSIAPDAQVYLYVGQDAQQVELSGLYGAALRAVDDDVADVLSLSYGVCEQELGLSTNLYMNNLWAQATAQGQSVFVASGDSGSGGCDNGQEQAIHGLAVNGFGSTPYNVSVGGTDFFYSDYSNLSAAKAQINTYWNTTGTVAPSTSLLSRIPEQPWNDAFGLNVGSSPSNDTTASGTGGASSCVQGTEDPTTGYFSACTAGYAKPNWQTGAGVPQDGVRDVPDVSLFAANGDNYSFWPICYEVTDCVVSNTDSTTGAVVITGIGGTSASSPAMAAIMALVDQSQKGRQGNPNFVLYPLAAQVPSVFHDVTVGSNNVPCTQGTPNCTLDTNGDGFYSLQKYAAGVGYDQASGLGSVDVNNLILNWNKITFAPTTTTLVLSSTSFPHGTAVTATSSVAAKGSAAGTPGGSVALISSSGGTTGLGTLALVNGTGQASLDSLPAGTYSLVAQYGGDGTFAGSTSLPVNVTVTPESSTVAVGGVYFGVDASGNTLASAPLVNGLNTQYGSFFQFDIQVYGSSSTESRPDGVPTGQITLTDNGTAWTTLNLNATGVAELQTSELGTGTHVIVASYSGDASFNATTSPSFTVTITKGVPQILISYSVGDPAGTPPSIFMPASPVLEVPVEVSSAAGQLPVGGTITVTYGSQSQTVQLSPVSFPGVAMLGLGIASFDNSTPGTYALNASYTGDANLQSIKTAFNPSQVTVYTNTLASTTTTLTANTTNVTPEGPLNVTVKVTGGTTTPTGSITLYQAGIYPLPGLLVSLDSTGTAVVPIPQGSIFSSGSLPFIATYLGDGYHNPSTSSPLTISANAGDFSFTTSTSVLTVASGASGTTTVSVGVSLSSFAQMLSGKVGLTCATSSPDIACSLSPSTLTLPTTSSQFASSTVTINTSIPVTKTSSLERNRKGWFAGGGLALAGLLLFGIPTKRRRNWSVGLCVMVVIAFGVAGCNSTPDTTPVPPVTPSNTNAPAGNYTVTIAAVGSGIMHTLVVKVVVP
jgi:trimeric autotransporter adhesin